MTDKDSVDRLTREWIEAVPDVDPGEYPVFARVMHAARLYEAAMSRTAAVKAAAKHRAVSRWIDILHLCCCQTI